MKIKEKTVLRIVYVALAVLLVAFSIWALLSGGRKQGNKPAQHSVTIRDNRTVGVDYFTCPAERCDTADAVGFVDGKLAYYYRNQHWRNANGDPIDVPPLFDKEGHPIPQVKP